MPNFAQGKIYSIRSYQTDDVYIGSTCQPLSKRFADHRGDKKSYEQGKHNFVTSFKLLEFDDAYIELIELYPCNTKDELHRREGQVIRETENCVNRCIAGRTKSEYGKETYEINKVSIIEKSKQYYKSNKQHVQKYKKEHYTKNKDAIKIYKHENYLKNKEHKKAKAKQNYEKRKEIISAIGKQKITCECGQEVSKISIKKHKKSLRHQKQMKESESESAKSSLVAWTRQESESDQVTSSDEE